jgi:hypothetical protein
MSSSIRDIAVLLPGASFDVSCARCRWDLAACLRVAEEESLGDRGGHVCLPLLNLLICTRLNRDENKMFISMTERSKLLSATACTDGYCTVTNKVVSVFVYFLHCTHVPRPNRSAKSLISTSTSASRDFTLR